MSEKAQENGRDYVVRTVREAVRGLTNGGMVLLADGRVVSREKAQKLVAGKRQTLNVLAARLEAAREMAA